MLGGGLYYVVIYAFQYKHMHYRHIKHCYKIIIRIRHADHLSHIMQRTWHNTYSHQMLKKKNTYSHQYHL
jgi:hypothetical protein